MSHLPYRALAAIAAVLALLLSSLAWSQASIQTYSFEVLIDVDRNAATGCSVTPTGGAAQNGVEQRLTATVEIDGSNGAVTAVERRECTGASFGAPVAVSPPTAPWPVNFDGGVAGADALELSVERADIIDTIAGSVALTFVADSGTGSDVLATVDGSPSGAPIVVSFAQPPVNIPVLSLWGLSVLLVAVLFLAWLAHRRFGKIGTAMAVMLVATAAWAMNFAVDGNLSDWTGIGPAGQDPTGDATDGSAANDLVAGFAAFEGDTLYFRIDAVDLENQVPVAVDDAYDVDEDTPLNIAAPGVLGNDTDADSDPLTASVISGPTSASAFTLNPDGSFDYTPTADFNGSDSFTYVANDGQADSNTATVTITVNAVNDPPVAQDDSATTNEDDAVDIDVLANDSDVDGNLDPASVSVTTPPSNGSAGVSAATGVITYTKAPDFNGTDSFVYEVCDDGTPTPAECASATVTVTIDPVNDAPTFTGGGNVASDEDAGAQTVAAWASNIDDGDDGTQALTFNVTANNNSGLFSAGPAVDATSGDLTYTAAPDANGSADITVALVDDGGTANGGDDTSAPVTFTITVDPVNDAPTFAASDPSPVLEDAGAQNVNGWAAFDPGPTDEAGQAVVAYTVANVSNPGLFSAQPSVDAAGNLSYTPAADANGSSTFEVTVQDDGGTANGGSDTSAAQTFTIAVTAVNDAPTFTGGGNVSSIEDAGQQTFPAWATNIDDGDDGTQALTFNVTANSNPGLFSAGPAIDATLGDLVFTAAPDANGSADITVALVDDGGTTNGGDDTSAPVTFTITVDPVDDPPAAVNDTAVVTEDDPATTIDVLANDSDIDAGPIGITSVTQPADGTVAITNAGADLTYEPDPEFCNDGSPTDDFSYTLNGGSFATVAVTVTCVNDPPVVAFPTAGVTFDPSVGPVNLDTAATLTDIDSSRFDRIEATLNIGGICDPLDNLTVQNQGTGVGQVGFDGATVTFEGAAISTALQPWACTDPGTGTQDAFIIQLDTNAGEAATEALLRALQFSSSSADTTSRTADVVVADDDSATGSAAQNIGLIRAPTAVADSFSVTLGSVDSSNSVLANDDEGIPAAVVDFYADTGDIGGASQVAAPGSYTHPTGNFDVTIDASGDIAIDASVGGVSSGSHAFDYQIINAAGSSVATVTVEIVQPPTAVSDDFAVVFDAAAPQFNSVDLLADNGNGVDNAGTPLFDIIEFGGGDLSGAVTDNFLASAGSITVPFSAAGGSLTLASTGAGTLSFSLSGTTSGTQLIPGRHTFQYRLTNSVGTSGVATVTLDVVSPPTAVADAISTGLGTSSSAAAATGLRNANDDYTLPNVYDDATITAATDVDNAAALTIGAPYAIPGTGGATLTINADGSWTLDATAATGGGTFNFDYTLANSHPTTSTAALTVSILTPPDGVDDSSANVLAGTSVPGDAFHVALNAPAALVGNLYVDNGGFGADVLGSPSAPTDPPADVIDAVTLAGVPDAATGSIGGGSLIIGGDGVIFVASNGDFSFEPPAGFVGVATFDYTLANSIGTDPTPATVTVAVGNRAACSADGPYPATGNVTMDTTADDGGANAFVGVLVNDSGDGIGVTTVVGSGDVVAPFVGSTANGGQVTLQAGGDFSYVPPVGFTGTDTFSYEISNGFGSTTTNCNVSIQVSDIVYFMDDSAAAGGNGTLAAPFSGIVDHNGAPPVANSFLFVEDNGNAYSGNLQLVSGQTVIGEGATGTLFGPGSRTGITLSVLSAPVPYSLSGNAGDRAQFTSATDGITLGTNNALVGLDIGNTAGTGVLGNGFGTLTASELSIAGTGRAISLDNGTAAVTLDSVASTNSTAEGVRLSDVGGSFTVTGTTTIDNPAGFGVNIQNVSAAYTFGDVTVNNRNSAGVSINAFTGGVQNGQFGAVTINNQNASGTTSLGIDNSTGGSITVGSAVIDHGNAGGSAIALSNNGANIDIQAGSVQNAAGAAVSISSGAGTISYAGSISNAVGRSVQVLNNNGGTISLTGNVTDTGQGIVVQNNTGASVNFSGTMTLTTGTFDAFTATGGGTVTASGANSALTTTFGTAVRIDGVDIGAAGFALRSATSAGGASPGIVLNNTGSTGAFQITGDGTASNNASGGSISGKNGNAVQLNSTGPVTITQMAIGAGGPLGNIGEIGIRAESVNGLTIRHSDFVNASGDDAGGGNDFAAVRVLSPVAGSNITLENNLFQRSFEDHVRIENGNATTGGGVALATISVTGNNFDDNDASGQGNDAFQYVGNNGSDATVNVTGNTFFNSDGDHVQIALNGTASADVTIGGLAGGDSNIMTSNGAGNVLGSGVTLSSGVGAGGVDFSGTLTYLIQGNDIQDAVSAAINVNLSASSTAAALYGGTIDANTIGAPGDPFSGGFGIIVNQNGDGTLNATVSDNTIRQYDGDHGLLLQARDGTGRLNAEVTGNDIAEPADAFVFDGLAINAGAISSDTSTVCANVQNNTLTSASGASSGGSDFVVATTSGAPAGTTVILPGYAGGPKDAAAVVSFVQGQNVGAPTGLAFFSGSSVGVLGTGASCL